MQRHGKFLLLLSLSLVWSACSHGNGTASSSPTSPGSVGGLSVGAQRVGARTLDIAFPPRNEPLDFRKQLEVQYQTLLRRTATSTFVDTEGDIVWTEEYLRYRVNGCDHPSAVQRVFTQINGGAAPAVCGNPLSVVFPPRNESLDFRRQLEVQYQTVLRRAAISTFVDVEGDAVWTQEYIRYRLNACDHSTATLDVFTQIAGNPAPPGCGCTFTLTPATQNVPSGGGNFSVQLTRSAGNCAWTATADSFITLSSSGGADPTNLTYSVAPNPNASVRTGRITINWQGGSTQLTLTQGAPPLFVGFSMSDPASQAGPTMECRFRAASSSTPTTCNFISTSYPLGSNGILSFAWTATYTYDAVTTVTQTSSSPTFSFTDRCGGSSATNDGVAQPLSVQLTVTDSAGNIATAVSGTGDNPSLFVRLFTCGF